MKTSSPKLSLRKAGRLVEFFVAETTATTAADLVGVSKSTAALFYRKIRRVIGTRIKAEVFAGEVEVDESYFGGVRKGKRGVWSDPQSWTT